MRLLSLALLLLGTLIPRSGEAQEARAGLAVWETGAASKERLKPPGLAERSGWSLVPQGSLLSGPKGDLVITNGRLLLVARRQGAGAELYSLGSGAPVFRACLALAGAVPNNDLKVSENGRGAVALEISSGGGGVRFRLKKGDLFVETQELSGEAPLEIDSASRFAVLPDFFADDILLDARKTPVDRVELPSENFLLQFPGKGDAMVMEVFENREQDIRLKLGGSGEERGVTGSEISYGKKGNRIWVAVLEGPGMWHSVEVGEKDKKKILPLDWKMPFVAQWRVDFTRKDGLTDSWDMLLADPEHDGYIKPSWLAQDGRISEATRTSSGEVDRDAYKPGGPASDRLGPDRKRWTTVLGHVEYPCWTDRERRGFLQPLEHKRLAFEGPVLVYPSTRLSETPVEAYTPVDVVRNTLGVGPCQYILDVEGQKQEHVGRATCHVRTLIGETYQAGQWKSKRKEIESYLGDALDFVTHIRKRILAYVDFSHELAAYLQAQRKSHPELGESLDSLEALDREIDERVGARMLQIKKHKTLAEIAQRVESRKEEPTPPALARELNRDFVASLLDYEGPDFKDRVKKEYTDPLTAIGGQQDEMVGECRWVVKALRQKAGILLATEPRMAQIALEIRSRTHQMLRGGAAYEGARH